jgi:hypothetical protein
MELSLLLNQSDAAVILVYPTFGEPRVSARAGRQPLAAKRLSGIQLAR